MFPSDQETCLAFAILRSNRYSRVAASPPLQFLLILRQYMPKYILAVRPTIDSCGL